MGARELTVTTSIAVVIPTRNRADLLSTVVRSVLAQENPSPAQVVVVDDGSTDATRTVLEQLAREDARVTAVHLDSWRGPAVARNHGWRTTQAEVVAFTDDDCLPQPGWLSGLAARLDQFEIVQGRTEADFAGGDPGAYSRVIDIRAFSYYFESCNIAYRRSVLADLGGFDEEFGVSRGGAPNGEDIDLGWRAHEAGARCGFADDALVIHPLTPMTFPHRVRSQLRSARMVYTVRRHPGLRQHLPGGRYFFDRSHPYALLAVGGIAAGAAIPALPGIPVAAAASMPYVWYRLRRVPVGGPRRNLPLTIPGRWVVDVADIAVLAAASVRWRTVLL